MIRLTKDHYIEPILNNTQTGQTITKPLCKYLDGFSSKDEADASWAVVYQIVDKNREPLFESDPPFHTEKEAVDAYEEYRKNKKKEKIKLISVTNGSLFRLMGRGPMDGIYVKTSCRDAYPLCSETRAVPIMDEPNMSFFQKHPGTLYHTDLVTILDSPESAPSVL